MVFTVKIGARLESSLPDPVKPQESGKAREKDSRIANGRPRKLL
jgi:hypothetical protein